MSFATAFPALAVMMGLGHSLLAMSGFETLAQVNRQIAHPKQKTLEKAGRVIFIYSLTFTSLVSFFAVTPCTASSCSMAPRPALSLEVVPDDDSGPRHRLCHRDAVGLALQRLKADLHGEHRAAILAAVSDSERLKQQQQNSPTPPDP